MMNTLLGRIKAMRKTIDIFILTSEWQDVRGAHLLRYYGISKEGDAVEIVIDNQKPLFFVPRAVQLPPSVRPALRKPLSMCNFAGEEVDALYFPTQAALRHAAARLKAANVPTYEADVLPDRRYLMERFIHAQARVTGEAGEKKRLTIFRNPRLTPCEVEPEFVVASLDIETSADGKRLYSIAVQVTGRRGEQRRVFLRSNAPFDSPDYISIYTSDKDLLREFMGWFQEVDPDILIGWHVVGFDLLHLQRFCRENQLSLSLLRDNRTIALHKRSSGGYMADIPGRVVVDGPMALRAAFFSFDDYSLETVAQKVVGTGKLISSGGNKGDEIERLFREDNVRLAEYNLQDCILVSEIFRRTGLLELLVRRSQISGLLLNQVGLSSAAFDHYFLPRLHRKGFVAPNVSDIEVREHAAGGYVMEPRPGIYEHVVVLDFKSLYPSIIRTFKIDPLSRLMADRNPITTPTGYRFSATEHALPEFIAQLMERRTQAKRAGDTHLSQAIKILMNSFYGVMGSSGCRFYHPDLPNAITSTGQWLLKGCKAFLEERGYRVLYGDTDSVFVMLKPDEAADPATAGNRLAERLNGYWQEELRKMGVTSFLEMEFEKYYRKFVLPIARAKEGGARKRYAGLLVQNGKETLEFVGMEYVRTDWTQLAKEFQYQLYWRLLKGEAIEKWIRNLVKSIRAGELDDKLVYQKRLRKDVSAYTKHVAPHVKAARMLHRPVNEVRYVITPQGAVPVELSPKTIDYEHYIDKQLRPIADSILGLLGASFDDLLKSDQLSFSFE